MTYKQKLQRNIKLFYLRSFTSALIFAAPVWVAFEKRFLSFSQVTSLEIILAALVISLELPTGALADLIGRRKTMVLGGLIQVAAFLYITFAVNFTMFFIATLIFALATAFISGSDIALVFDTFKELNRVDDFIDYNVKSGMIFRVGFIMSTFLGGYLYQIWPGLPYLLMAFTSLLTVSVIFFTIEPHLDTITFTLKSYINQTKLGFQQLFKNSYMKRLTTYYTLVGGITWSCLYYFNQSFIKDVGFSDIQVGWMLSLSALLTSLIIYFLLKQKNLVTRNRVYLGLPLIMSLSLLPGFWTNRWLTPVIILGISIAGTLRFVILDKYTNQDIESRFRATAVSALNMLVNMFFIVILSLSGKIQDLYSTKLIFSLLGVLTIFLVFPSGWSLVKEYRRYKLNQLPNEA